VAQNLQKAKQQAVLLCGMALIIMKWARLFFSLSIIHSYSSKDCPAHASEKATHLTIMKNYVCRDESSTEQHIANMSAFITMRSWSFM
jgi:hypothetical protein